jgi:threonylcarbamoyladenosine tRNA methylthiotransferase MtaB
MTTRTWERGAGLTLACGSAACASGVSSARTGRTSRTVTITVASSPNRGTLQIEWRDDDHVIMTGPAEWEWSGTLDPFDRRLPPRRCRGGGALSGVEVITFGCRLNTYESEVMRAEAEKAGLNNAVLVNTCAVTGEAVRQARQAIRRARRDNPHARIIVTGCAAQTEKHTFADMPEVDAVLGNEEKLKSASYRALPDFGVSAEEKLRVNDIMSVRETAPQMVKLIDGHVRAFVQVQNGCDHRCTFCIIPYGRGNSRSVPMGAVVDQARTLVESGYSEIVLTGVDATSYGADLPGKPSLGQLARTLLKQVPEIQRLRLSSIDSIEADEHLWDLIADEPRFMPHLHLSLQHGDDMILKRMKRRHSSADAVAFCERVKTLRPDDECSAPT